MSAKFLSVPSKLLLFGEHSVLMGSPAVILPLWKFPARLRIPEREAIEAHLDSNEQLSQFYHYLAAHPDWFEGHIHLKNFKDTLKKGVFLESLIPIGYGLGSSASVCVAVYKVFGKTNLKELNQLKIFYSRMESFFHGKSSGLDPVAVHVNKPILVDGIKIQVIEHQHKFIDESIHTYLLDSGISRNASAIIETFQAELQNEVFKNAFLNDYLPILQSIKENVIKEQPIGWDLLKAVSSQQLTYFRKLIPEPVYAIWKQSISDKNTCIKLLGAGGGGYFLVFSEKELSELGGFKVIKI
jgi:mevalonate kinase